MWRGMSGGHLSGEVALPLWVMAGSQGRRLDLHVFAGCGPRVLPVLDGHQLVHIPTVICADTRKNKCTTSDSGFYTHQLLLVT
jgi:hypothetical protein